MIDNFASRPAAVPSTGAGSGFEAWNVSPHWRAPGHEPGFGAWMCSKTRWTPPLPRCRLRAPGAGPQSRRVERRPDGATGRRCAAALWRAHLVFNNAGVGAGGLVWRTRSKTGNGCWA